MAKQKANAEITAQTKINDEMVEKTEQVYIPIDMEGCVAEYGESACVDMIVNQKVLATQADIRRAIKVENGTISEGSSVRRGIKRI